MATYRPDTDDSVLASASRRGSLAAFEQLVVRHQRLALNIACRMTGNYDDACDITQEAFLAAWRKIGDFRGEARFSTWLTAIVLNLCRTRLQQTQSAQQREAYSLDAPLPGNPAEMRPDPPSTSPTALEQMEEAELRQTVRGCIDSLPPEFREVLVLRDMQEFSYDEVRQTLQLQEGTVKSRLFRAREGVKDCLKRAIAAAQKLNIR